MSEVSVAIFGGGRIGAVHLTNALNRQLVSVGYVVEKDETMCSLLAQRFPMLCKDQILTADFEDKVFQDERIKAIVVATPTSEHERLVLKGLNAGKDVFCEKPIAADVKTAKKCYELAQLKGRLLFCAFQRRFDPSFMEMYKMAKSGAIGKLQSIKVCSRDQCLPPKEYLQHCGSFFRDSTVHDFDMCCWVSGEFPTSVYAAAHAHDRDVSEAGDWDYLVVALRFPSGLLATIDQSRYAVYGYDQRVEVMGSKGMIEVGNPTDVRVFDATGRHPALGLDGCINRYKDAYRNELDHFIRMVLGKNPRKSNGEQAIGTLLLAAAAERSARSNTVQTLHQETPQIWPD